MSSAFRLSMTVWPRALSFAEAEMRAGSWLSTRIFSLTRTCWSLYVNARSTSSWAGARAPPSADAKVLRMLNPVSDPLSPAWWGSSVRTSRTRAASKTNRWNDRFAGSAGSNVCRRQCCLESFHSSNPHSHLPGFPTTGAAHPSSLSAQPVLPVYDHVAIVTVPRRSRRWWHRLPK